MSKITFDVDKKDLNTVLTILNNLKQGLVKNISVDNKATNSMQTKKAVKNAVLEDEFLSSKPTNSKYLSKSAYKQKMSNN